MHCPEKPWTLVFGLDNGIPTNKIVIVISCASLEECEKIILEALTKSRWPISFAYASDPNQKIVYLKKETGD